MNDYPATLKVAPLTTWPGQMTPADARLRSPFSTSLAATLQTLNRELDQLNAQNPVLEVAIPENQFRIDGRPRATAKADHPGVVLSLPKTSVGPLRYAADRFLTWQDNLRAIALGLEALRKVDRYGITRRGEQYTGFKALPSAPSETLLDDALRTLAAAAQWPVAPAADDPDDIRLAYRQAVKLTHPDAGGDSALFRAVQSAMDLIRGQVPDV